MSYSAAFAAGVYRVRPDLWWTDLLVSTFCALWLVFYGAYKLWTLREFAYWRAEFWTAAADAEARAAAKVRGASEGGS